MAHRFRLQLRAKCSGSSGSRCSSLVNIVKVRCKLCSPSRVCVAGRLGRLCWTVAAAGRVEVGQVFGRLMVSRVIRLGHPTPFTDHKTGESDIGPSLGLALPTFTMSPVAFPGSGSAAPQRGVSGRHGVRIAYGTSNCLPSLPSLPSRPFCAPTWPPTWYRPAWCRAAVPCGRCRCLWSPAVPTRRRHRNAA